MKAMVYIYACLLLKEGGKEITGEKIAQIISAVGEIPDPTLTSLLESKADVFDKEFFPLQKVIELEEELEEEQEDEYSTIMDLFK